MKNSLVILFICIALGGFSQTPQLINYQAVARDGSGNIVTTAIGIKFQIYQGTVGGTLVYEETHTATPSSAGIFTVHIGGGSPVSGTFNTITWGSNAYFLQVSIDPAGGTSYSIVGSHQLVSVPYALFAAKTPAPLMSVTPTGTSNILTVNGSSVNIPSGSAAATPTLIGTPPITVTPQPAIGTPTAYIISTGTATSVTTSSLQINSPHTITTLAPNNYSIGIAPTNVTGSGIANVTGTYPNYNVSVPAPVLSVSGNTISLTTGSAVTSQTVPPGPWMQTVGSVSLTNANDNVSIGTTVNSAKLNIATPAGFSSNDISVVSNSSVDALQVFKLTGAGAGVRIFNASSTSTAVASIFSSTGNAVGLDVNISSNNSGVASQSSGTAAAVFANNTWSGPSVRGTKTATGGASGPAGLFDINSTSSSADGLIGSTVGSGAAIHAISGTANTSSVALWLENGHLRSTSVAPPTVSLLLNNLGGGTVTPTITANSTDVKGVVTAQTSVASVPTGNYVDINVTFNKPYTAGPTVVVSQFDQSRMSFSVINMSNTFFTVRMLNNTGAALTIPSNFLRFSYIVIE